MQNSVGYRKTYRLRMPEKDTKYIEVGVPWDFADREARLRGLTVEEFVKKFRAVATYGDGIEGVNYTFEEITVNVPVQA